MKFVKSHPGMIWLLLSLISGEYWMMHIAPTSVTLTDWAINFGVGACLMMATMFPCGGLVILFWSFMGWWDETDT